MMTNVQVWALLLLFVFGNSCKGLNKTELPKDDTTAETRGITAFDLRNHIKRYGKGVIIQNSGGPKGGPYTDPTGKKFGYGIFWTRVINESDTPLELTINFPADSFAIPPSPQSYIKLFLAPDDTTTADKESQYDYDAPGLKSLLDAGLKKSSRLQRTINPKEDHLFYFGAITYQSAGLFRAELVLKEQDLFYKVSITPHFESVLFPCGKIRKKQGGNREY
jgi:hypothetical protein